MKHAFRLYTSGRKRVQKYARPLLARHLFQTPFNSGARRVLFVYFPNNIGASQIYPFFYHHKMLTSRFGLEFRSLSLPEFMRSDRHGPSGADIVLMQSWYDLDDREKATIFGKLNDLHPGATLIYLDWFAPLDLRLAEFLNDRVKFYIKKQVFRDYSRCSAPTIGPTNLVDYYAKQYELNFDIVQYNIPSDFKEKLLIGPGFFTAHNLMPGFAVGEVPASDRPIDLNARINTEKTDWYGRMRRDAHRAASALKGRTVAAEGGIPRRQYIAELRRSKICFSPFGYGEVCWRDFEAMMTGSMLLKPDVSHLVTDPDVFIPGTTYVPIAWDFSDLAEKVEYYLAHEDEREAIARNAYSVVHDYVAENRFTQFAQRFFAA